MATINQMARYNFNNFSTSTSTSKDSTSSILEDYASINNGSYKKLLKSYYSKVQNSNTNMSTSTSSDSTKTLARIKDAATSLISSADALTTKGAKSVFNKKEVTTTDASGNKTTTNEYDRAAIYKAAKEFVSDYNTLKDEGQNAESNSILKPTLSMTRLTTSNKELLSVVGITIGSDNKLTINEDKFKKADMNAVKTLFNGATSFAAEVAGKASKVNGAAVLESLKANTYTDTATYSNAYSMGNIYNSMF